MSEQEPLFQDEPYEPGQYKGVRCPTCGAPNDLCSCGDEDFGEYEEPDYTCEYCSGTGGEPYDDFCTPCPKCDGMGYYWWLP